MSISACKASFARIFTAIASILAVIGVVLTGIAGAQPIGVPNDIAAYEAQGGRPVPRGGPSFGPSFPSRVPRLEAHLRYAEEQYGEARQKGDRAAAKHWKKEIKHLRHELREGDAEAPRYGAPTEPMRDGYGYPPGYAYPAVPNRYSSSPMGYQQAPPAQYPPIGYSGAYGPAEASNPPNGLSTVLGALLGRSPAGIAPTPGYPTNGYSGAAYPPTGYASGAYPQSAYPAGGAPTTAGSIGDVVNSLIGSTRGSLP